jgi:hypothetical protein
MQVQRRLLKKSKLGKKNTPRLATGLRLLKTRRKKLMNFAEKKITLKWDFKVPQIPGFENGVGGTYC